MNTSGVWAQYLCSQVIPLNHLSYRYMVSWMNHRTVMKDGRFSMSSMGLRRNNRKTKPSKPRQREKPDPKKRHFERISNLRIFLPTASCSALNLSNEFHHQSETCNRVLKPITLHKRQPLSAKMSSLSQKMTTKAFFWQFFAPNGWTEISELRCVSFCFKC